MGFYLKIKNYRGIRSADFTPDGVCAIAGPNGSGKSTLLSAVKLLRDAVDGGFDKALNLSGGPWGFANFDLPSDTPTEFVMAISDLQWELRPSVNASGAVYPIPEKIMKNGKDLLFPREIAAYCILSRGKKAMKDSLLLSLCNSSSSDSDFKYKLLEDFISVLKQYQNYHDYHLWQLRKSGSQAGSETELRSRGENAFSVLRNWHNSRPFKVHYEFVCDVLREAFPAFFDDLDFESAGQTVTIRIYPPDSDAGIPVYFAPNGFLTALLHLMAVCSVPEGGILAIDEPENSLHPHAIKTLLNAFRNRAEDFDITVLLATHSPFLLNEFREEPDRVYIMDQNREDQLVRLDKLRDPEWLRYFSLGDLYGNDFARQEDHAVTEETV